MDLRQRRELNNGFGESLSRAFELALTPAIFAVLGYALDHRLGTSPLCTVSFFGVVMTYMIWKLFVRYDAAMREQEAALFGTGGARGRASADEVSDT